MRAIASPVDLVVNSARALGARIAPAEAARAASRMGQSLFRPPSVKGWDGGRAWINAGTWLARHTFLARLAAAQVEPDELVEVDLGRRSASPRRSTTFARAVVGALLHREANEDELATLGLAAREAASLDEALAGVAALVLTSPEYHLA